MALFNGTPGFDEIVFASRNRDYGAYKLRKRYFSALLTGLISAILIACIVVLIPFFSNRRRMKYSRAEADISV